MKCFVSAKGKIVHYLYFPFFIHLFICAYIVWAISPPCPCPLLLPPTTLLPGRTCSDLFYNFVKE
jgi:hypothetical protein